MEFHPMMLSRSEFGPTPISLELRKLRRDRYLPLRPVAAAVGLTVEQIAQLENGVATLSDSEWFGLLDAVRAIPKDSGR
jgi:transcriptional regulator with XRE-family HTH domain